MGRRKKPGTEKKSQTPDPEALRKRKQVLDMISERIKKNLIILFDSEPRSRRKCAEKIGISPSSISKWLMDNATGPPRIDYLYIIANHFGVSIDWITGNETDTERPPGTGTDGPLLYSEAFRVLLPLTEKGILTPEGIRDPILSFLVKQGQKALRPEMPEKKKEAWIARINDLFIYPLPDKVDPELWIKLLENDPEIIDPDPINEYSALAKTVTDPERLEKSRKRCGL